MLLGLLALALVDSINPSAIVVTLYLLSRGRVTAQILVYITAIFATYLTLGAMMMSGIDALLPSVRTGGDGRLEFIVQGVIGLAMLIYAIREPTTAHSTARTEPSATTTSSCDWRLARARRCAGSWVCWAVGCSPGAPRS